MHIESIGVGPFQVNCFIVHADHDALVIDPGADPELIIDVLDREQLHVSTYVLTHGHCDHISALPALVDAHPAPIAVHPADAAWAFTPDNHFPPFYEPIQQPPVELIALQEGERYGCGALRYTVVETPGHTPGSVCIMLEGDDVVFSGDTLFAGSVGRTDLQGGDSRQLATSVRRLRELPDAVVVYPGHGPSTTLGHEKAHNFFMRDAG